MEVLMTLGGGVGLLTILYFLYMKFTGAQLANSQAEYKKKDNLLEFKQKELIVKSEDLKKEITIKEEDAKKLSPAEIENTWNKK